jgi:hypothetical protein
VLRALLQQAVREAARRGADVEAAAAGDVDREVLERVGELDAAARDEARRLVDGHDDVGRHELPRLLGARAVSAEPHLTRHHRRGGTGARLEQAALGQEGVKPDAGHGGQRYPPALV